MSPAMNEFVRFRLFQMPCCGQQLCWVNPRLPSHCPECSTRVLIKLRSGEHTSVDQEMWLRTETKLTEEQKDQTITCQRCNGTGQVDSDEGLGPRNCMVCDGQPTIDYAMVKEYARQIDYFMHEAVKRERQLHDIVKLAALVANTTPDEQTLLLLRIHEIGRS